MSNEAFEMQFTGKSGAENFAEMVKAAEARAASEQPGAAAEFNADMQRAGLQQPEGGEPVAVDQTALNYLQKAYKDMPAEKRTTAWLTMYERDLQTVLGGRRMGESLTDFERRQQGAAAQPTPDSGSPYVVASALTDEQRAGYSIPETYRGYEFDTSALAAARAAGVSQAQFEAFCRRLAGP